MRRLSGIALGIVLSLFATSVPAGEDKLTQDQIDRIDKLFSAWEQDGSPGAALGIIKNGELIYGQGYGLADLEHDVPIDPATVFYMASVSKHFVTMCILLLEEQGKLDLDDKIQVHLPDFPEYESALTIRHFVHHTSGVRDNLTLWGLAGNNILDHIDETAIYEMIKRQKELNFAPGEKYLYSNSCYFMLAMIVQKVSGQSIKDFAEEHMFGPLGMTNTHFHDDVDHIIKNRAFSYRPSEDGFSNIIMRFDLVGSGGLYSNIEDMVIWDRNFNDNQLGKGGPELIEKMRQEGLLNSGVSSGYAFGIINGSYRGLSTMEHGGALAGYRTYYLRFPDQQTSVVVLGNVSSFRSSVARDVAAIVLEDVMEDRPTPIPSGEATQRANRGASNRGQDENDDKPESQNLEEFVGSYYSEELGVSYEVFLEETTLKYRIKNRYQTPQLLFPAAKDRVRSLGGITFRFTRDGDHVSGFRLDAGRVVNLEFVRE